MHTSQVEFWSDNWLGLEPRYIEDMAHATECCNCKQEFDERDERTITLEDKELYFCDQDCKHEYDDDNAYDEENA